MTVQHAQDIGRRIRASLAAAVDFDGLRLALPPSIGIVCGLGGRAEDLLVAAEMATGEAKHGFGDSPMLFDDAFRDRRNRRLAIEQQLRLSFHKMDGFQVHFQPIVAADAELCGVEALLRWTTPALGTVSPDEFIAVAEELGYASRLDFWVLRQALTSIRASSLGDCPDLRVGVNFSPATFLLPGLSDLVARTLAETGTAAGSLTIEITERVMIDDPEVVGRNIHALRALGVRVVLDDFGTGYSSLSYLKRLELDGLKIDRAFVNGAVGDARAEAVLQSVMALAESLDFCTVAEGIETAEQMALLQRLGCRRFQGYLLARPEPVDKVDGWVSRLRVNAGRSYLRCEAAMPLTIW